MQRADSEVAVRELPRRRNALSDACLQPEVFRRIDQHHRSRTLLEKARPPAARLRHVCTLRVGQPEGIPVSADFKTPRDRHEPRCDDRRRRRHGRGRRFDGSRDGDGFFLLGWFDGRRHDRCRRFRSGGSLRHARHHRFLRRLAHWLWSDNHSRRGGRSTRSCRWDRIHCDRLSGPRGAAGRRGRRQRSIRSGHIRRRRTSRISDRCNDEHGRGNKDDPLKPRRVRSGRGQRGHRCSVARRSKHRRSNHGRSNHRRRNHRRSNHRRSGHRWSSRYLSDRHAAGWCNRRRHRYRRALRNRLRTPPHGRLRALDGRFGRRTLSRGPRRTRVALRVDVCRHFERPAHASADSKRSNPLCHATRSRNARAARFCSEFLRSRTSRLQNGQWTFNSADDRPTPLRRRGGSPRPNRAPPKAQRPPQCQTPWRNVRCDRQESR